MKPKIPIGIVPRMMYQPMRASRSLRTAGSRSERTQALAMRHRSWRKYRSTAAIVPSWTTAVNAAPGSGHPKNAGTMRRWAVLEIGRNSVSPWTIPSTMAWKSLMAARKGSGAKPARPGV